MTLWHRVGWLAGALALVAAARAQEAPRGPQGSEVGVYADAHAEAWSNGLPVMDLSGDWSRGYVARTGTQRAWASARAEAGVSLVWPALHGLLPAVSPQGAWRLGAVARADATATLSGDAAEVLRLYQARHDPDQPGTYDATTRLRHWQGSGLAWHAPALRWQGWTLNVGGDQLRLQRLRSMDTTGSVAYNADGSYTYAGTLRDDDSRYRALFMTPPEARGQGASLSLALSWAPGELAAGDGDMATPRPSHVRLSLDDAWSRLVWGGVNGNDAVLDSNVQTRDADGRVAYKAAILGRYTRRTVVERIPMRGALDVGWVRDSGTWSLQAVQRVGLWQRWLAWQGPGVVQPALALDPWARAVRVAVQGPGWQLGYLSGLGDGAQRIRGLQLAVSWPLWRDTPR